MHGEENKLVQANSVSQ